MTPEQTGKAIVAEFHQNTFFYQSVADEWLATRIDTALKAAIETEAAKWAKGAKIQIPTDALEQELAAHYRRGYKDGVASVHVAQPEPAPKKPKGRK